VGTLAVQVECATGSQLQRVPSKSVWELEEHSLLISNIGIGSTTSIYITAFFPSKSNIEFG